ncbi:SEL1-like repeat protein [Agrobacterium vitis]|uniref:Sel1 repeat family protein n=1 Tax=Agrobacterium vitis TaxID=373 RepID=A0A7K1RJL5_AGRVI|nr:sel1 repeat family protein [Agrobacterium vitis]MVA58185.1 sel1 repeat family protein [Agrobacterium vitis]
MARFDMQADDMAAIGGQPQADIFRIMGLMYATGRGCEQDLVSAHKWLNIAAIKGCDRSVGLRSDLASTMTKSQLAEALRDAREWMTSH